MATTAITATMAMVLRGLTLFFCVVGRIASCAALILDKRCEYAKNTSEKRFTGGNSADYFAVKGICLLLRCWARQDSMVFMLEG
ncbi:hypothetical protein RG268_08170 [Bifidobacterium adolescentis]|uniref:hypothetical protein n=1 Tax=Bifidobacterium adolescentis TaxID=1680 RepID=UPI004064BF5C